MTKAFRRLPAIAFLIFLSSLTVVGAQPLKNTVTPDPKPYAVQTSGKQVTIKGSRNIKNIMVWTSTGDRVVEQKDLHTQNYSFTVPVSANYFFMMVGMSDGKIYTEKIGIR
jgi:hypothetical protein